MPRFTAFDSDDAQLPPVPFARRAGGDAGGPRQPGMSKRFLQSGALKVVRLDAARTIDVDENIAILLLAARFGPRCCRHAGGAALSAVVQQVSMFDYVTVSGTVEGQMIEAADHPHERFVTTVAIDRGHYGTRTAPGPVGEMLPESIDTYRSRHDG